MNALRSLLELVVEKGGSDLHLVAGQCPRIRLHGTLHRIKTDPLDEDTLQRLVDAMLPSEAFREHLREMRSVDFAHAEEGLGRFRVNVYRHEQGLGAALRLIPETMRPLEALGLPHSVASAIGQTRGLTLVTGPTGSGKTTTLAAMVDHINQTRRGHIITIEDPIEYLHEDKLCSVTQREVGVDSPSFAEALRNALREDPDVIMVGEMRDPQTISLAITAAETGIQVLASVHTSGAARTVDRIVSAFAPARQVQVRNTLADGLRLVVSQQLVPDPEGTKRHLVAEVLLNVQAVSTMLRTGKANQLASVILSGQKLGMQSMDMKLKELLARGAIAGEEAYRHAIDKTEFESFAFRMEVS